MDINDNNRRFREASPRFTMAGAYNKWAEQSGRLRNMEDRAERLKTIPPEELDAEELEFLKEYEAFKAEMDDLYSVATTGHHLSEFEPVEEHKPQFNKGWA